MRAFRVLRLTLVICALAAVAAGCSSTSSKGSDAGSKGGSGSGGGAAGTGSDGGAANPDGGLGTGTADGGGAAGSGAIDGGGSGGSGAVDAPPAISDIAGKIADGVCGGLLTCVGTTKLANLVGGEVCSNRVKLELLAGEFSYLQKSIDAGRVVINEGSLDACVSGIKDMGCKVQTDSFPNACEIAVEGKVKVGDTCTISSDCVGTAFCQIKSCPAMCAPLLAAGATCNKDDECGDDLICNAGSCDAPVREGADCAGTTGKVCALGFSCWNGTASKSGICHSNAETLIGAKNATCEPGGALCKEGLSCVFDGSSAFHCEGPAATGAACHRGLPGQCPLTDYCDTMDTAVPPDPTLPGTCKKLPGDGVACVYPGVCQAGMVCVPATKGPPVCRPIHDNGGACSLDAACRSGYCNAAKCEPPAICTP